jgi:hypothetical protein
MKLAIFGSASGTISLENQHLCKEIGEYLAQKNITVVTGGSRGVLGLVVQSAFEAGGKTEVYSPDKDGGAHELRRDSFSLEYFTSHKFIPGLTARSLEMIKNVDAALIINGRIGTLSEFTMALEEGLDIAVIKGTGGIADHLEYILSVAEKEFSSKIIFETDYKIAIEKLFN